MFDLTGLGRISNHSITSALDCENLAGFRRRTERKIQTADRHCLAAYIRLLEPMYIKSVQVIWYILLFMQSGL